MAGQIIVSSIKTDSDNSISFVANTGATIFSANLASGLSASSFGNNTITSDKIVSVANTKIDGNIVSSQITSVANTQLTGTVTSAQVGSSVYEGMGMRNRIINGAFNIAQRGTSFTSTGGGNNDDTYNLDRWYVLSDGNDAVDITQTTTVPTDAKFSIGLDVETTNKKFGIAQIIENANCFDAIGQTVTLSFDARVSSTTKLDNVKCAIVAWSGTADTVTSDIISAWGAEGTNPTLIANATYENSPANLNVTTSFARYTVSAAVDTSSTTNIIVFIWSDVTDTTAGDFLYITNVQLEVGSVATPFERRPFGTELFLCQRYYWVFTSVNNGYIGMLTAYATTSLYGVLVTIPVLMRATPSVSQSGNFTAYRANGSDSAGMPTTIGNLGANEQNILTTAWGGGSGLVAGYASVVQGATGAKLIASAEL